ncbi:protocadherin-like wing polarity protein stan [Caerostris extrusa]|uniref:Protocadherin-like wing polarity protein stan n=1 Tax=Caerostris extrusa TaxID=172846 RepID=A0AAV4UMH3_CAEEX|nr:protocadherin-like wing polarity protein stan [Caerostris extrusa]
MCELRTRSFEKGTYLTFPALRQRHRLSISMKNVKHSLPLIQSGSESLPMDPSCLIALTPVPEFFRNFSFYVPVGRGTVFDGEIAAILTALSQLQCHLEKFTRAVILCYSRAALLAIVSNNNPKTQDILDCRYHLENLASLEKTIVLQFATQERHALLLYNGRYNDEHDFISLEIINAQLVFSFSLGGQISQVPTFVTSGVSDGQWHKAEITYFNRTAILSVDDCDVGLSLKYGKQLRNYLCANVTTRKLEKRCSDFIQSCYRFLDLTGPLQIGGLPALQSDFQVQNKYFIGCIQDLYIDSQLVDLNSYVANNGTLIGCPQRIGFCHSSPCKNGGTCFEGWGRFIAHVLLDSSQKTVGKNSNESVYSVIWPKYLKEASALLHCVKIAVADAVSKLILGTFNSLRSVQ